jgi:hypothetical protein
MSPNAPECVLSGCLADKWKLERLMKRNDRPLSETGPQSTRFQLGRDRHIAVDQVLSPDEPRIKEDLIRLIAQYLNEEGYQASKLTLLDECNLKSRERDERQLDFLRLRKAILGASLIDSFVACLGNSFIEDCRRRLG